VIKFIKLVLDKPKTPNSYIFCDTSGLTPGPSNPSPLGGASFKNSLSVQVPIKFIGSLVNPDSPIK